MPYPFTIRRATPSDKEAMLHLIRTVDPHDWLADEYDSLMDTKEPAGFFLAEAVQTASLIGCYHLIFPIDTEAYLCGMRIHPDFQGRGLGSLLCRAQIEQARTLGAGNIYLASAIDNLPAHSAVQKNGFECLGDWVIYEMQHVVSPVREPQCARMAASSDLPSLERFRDHERESALSGVICAPYPLHALMSIRESDWTSADLVVVDGASGLDGVMLLHRTAESILIRRLQGTLEAAHDLLAFAVAEFRRSGCNRFQISLAATAEPLLGSLGLLSDAALRLRAFRFSSSNVIEKIG